MPVTQRTGDSGRWVLPLISPFLLLGNNELVFRTDLVCLFRVVFCNYVPARLTENNSTLVYSANVASVLGLIRPGLGGAWLDQGKASLVMNTALLLALVLLSPPGAYTHEFAFVQHSYQS